MKKNQETKKMKRFIGVDLHTDKFNICELDRNTNKRKRAQFFINEEDLEAFTSLLDKNTIVML